MDEHCACPVNAFQRMISRELKALAESHVILRRDFGTVPPRVEYELTELGRSLLPLIEHMQVWGIAHLMPEPAADAAGGFALATSRT